MVDRERKKERRERERENGGWGIALLILSLCNKRTHGADVGDSITEYRIHITW